jgi:hypothetical protein
MYDDYDSVSRNQEVKKLKKTKSLKEEEDEYFNREITPTLETNHYACDKQSNLYVLQQEQFITGAGYISEAPTNCSRYEKNILEDC